MSRKPTITVEITPGELIDKITILEIKSQRIADSTKVDNVRNELVALVAAREREMAASAELDALAAQLKSVNERLWEIEDAIRVCEREKNFGDEFIELARAIYKTNDERAALKREVNVLLGSWRMEEKSYADYQ